MAFTVATSGLPVRAVLAHVVLDRVVRGDGFAGVAPKALQDVVLHQPMLDVPVVDVGDLELAAGRRPEFRDHLPYGAVIEVDPGHREVAGGVGRLLDDALDSRCAVHLRDAEVVEVPAVLLAPEHHPCALGLLLERLDARADGGAEDVVAQQHDRSVAADEMFGQAQGLRDPSRPVLVGVEQAVDAELFAVAEQAQELAGVGAARHQHHLRHTALDQRLDRVADHRAVVDREQVLVGDAGQRVQAAARAAREDHSLHARILVGGFGRLRLRFVAMSSPPPGAPNTRFSDDGFWWWDGASWKPAVSPDRLWRWNGQTWVPAQAPAPPGAPQAQGGGTGMAVLITVGIFIGVLVLVSILVTVILLTMGTQIANVFSNVVAALGS